MTRATLSTPRHKHRMVRIPENKFGLAVIRLLRKQIYRTTDLVKVEASPYPYGVVLNFKAEVAPGELAQEVYYMSLLSVLHRWTGLTLDMREWTEKDTRP